MSKNKLRSFFQSQIVLIISLLSAIITSFFAIPKWSYIDFKVLILLFNLMAIVAALNKFKVLDKAAITLLKKCTTERKVNLALVFITFVASMFVTNDVALITFVPLAIIVGKKANIRVLKTVVLQTLAANLGSSLTPMGNPQNLFIYSYYNMSPIDFLKITSAIVLLGIAFLLALILIERDKKIDFEVNDILLKDKVKILIVILLFLIIILSVFNILDYRITLVLTILTVLGIDSKLFAKVDYSLLLTFVGFFIFVGNISAIPIVRHFMESMLSSSADTYFKSILVSQVISNVPATVLISGFTNYSKELLLAVNIGGMGTLVASLASLISYKLYIKEYNEQGGKFLKVFTIYNALGLILFVPLIYLLITLGLI